VGAALRYRAQAPIIDGLMKELGLDGSSLDTLVAGASETIAPTALKPKSAATASSPKAPEASS